MEKDFTIADVLAWARTKPAREHYNYPSLNNCALAQFIRAQGLYLHCDERHHLERGRVGMAACCNSTFGGFVRALERQIEPNFTKRLWARISGTLIDGPRSAPRVSDVWTKPDAYLADIELVEA